MLQFFILNQSKLALPILYRSKLSPQRVLREPAPDCRPMPAGGYGHMDSTSSATFQKAFGGGNKKPGLAQLLEQMLHSKQTNETSLSVHLFYILSLSISFPFQLLATPSPFPLMEK